MQRTLNNKNFAQPAVIIPAYQPNGQLIQLVYALQEQRPDQLIIVVNDGSDSSLQCLFEELETAQVEVLHHARNLGKGKALKTAFEHYLEKVGERAIGVVTADADGQHSVEDIVTLLDALVEGPKHLHLGVRDFSLKDIPLRSKLGNRLTGFIFRKMCTSTLYDTQTGLRGIPIYLMGHVIERKANGYELELEMLFLAADKEIAIQQTPIKTIYIDHNSASHFNPLIDSLKVYLVFIRFAINLSVRKIFGRLS